MTMSERYIDISEFLSVGFLQEANRQFFHPLGLALETRTITSDWSDDEIAESHWMANEIGRVQSAIAEANAVLDKKKDSTREQARAVCRKLYPKGTTYLSGVWDYRNDPEGMVFAEKLDPEKAKRVRALRAAHFTVRCDLFGVDERYRTWLQDPDHQPLDWAPSVGPPRPPWESDTR